MSIEITFESLKAMKFSGFVSSLEQQLSQPNTYQSLPFEDRLGMLVSAEETARANKKIKRLITQARFKIAALPEEIDYHHPRGLKKEQLAYLMQGDWLQRKQNILLTAPTGCGKTFLACAIGQNVCQQGFSVKYYRTHRFLESLTIAHADGSYPRVLKNLSRINLLILDDWGLNSLNSSQRTDLLEIMEDRYEIGSTLVTSQLPKIEWFKCVGDPTLADAILDRLLHNAHSISLKGDSMRKKTENLTLTDQKS